ncbi:SDR family NAD(P)-dependent oxidoreductase [Aliiroseovarius sp. 2305UL8-7]|uniref:SDR family NAD(P)-dependent oxidoreductase n=1 Tax=Aliiroseovarius conchicola TaxID=3121637 RepID=UPI0035271CCB
MNKLSRQYINKLAVVTGASQGLGFAFLECLLEKGYTVVATSRDISTVSLTHPRLHWRQVDLRLDQDIGNLSKYVSEIGLPVEILANNAAINGEGVSEGKYQNSSKLGSISRSAMLEMFEINSIAPLLLTQELLRHFDTKRAFVINVSSSRASQNDEFQNLDGNYGYRASKAALNMITFSSAIELPDGTSTFSVHPGGVTSRMNPKGKLSARHQARKILRIVSNWNNELNGKFLNYDGAEYDFMGFRAK